MQLHPLSMIALLSKSDRLTPAILASIEAGLIILYSNGPSPYDNPLPAPAAPVIPPPYVPKFEIGDTRGQNRKERRAAKFGHK